MWGYLWLVLGVLGGVVLLFFWVDHWLLRDKQKDGKASADDTTPAEPTAAPETKAAPQTPRTATIYNSNLADELDAALKQKPAVTEPRPSVYQTSKRSNIAQYIAQKNYQSFDFEQPGLTDAEPDADKFSVSKEDYKKMVALSNITDKK